MLQNVTTAPRLSARRTTYPPPPFERAPQGVLLPYKIRNEKPEEAQSTLQGAASLVPFHLTGRAASLTIALEHQLI